MISTIIKILNSEEKYYFKYILILMFINSFFELVSLAVFYPLIKFLTNETYGLDFINSYLAKFNYQIVNENELIYFYLVTILIAFIIKNIFYVYFIYEQNKFIKKIRLRVSNELFKKYINLQYSIFFKKSLANILRNIDLSVNFSTIVTALLTLFTEILVVLILIGFLLNIEIKITLAIIFLMSLSVISLKTFSKDRFYKLGVVSQKYAEIIKKEIIQIFSGIREIKILKKEKFFNNKFNKINYLEANNNFIRDILLQIPKVIIETLVVLLIVILISSLLVLNFDKSIIISYISLIIIASIRLMPSSIRIIGALQRLKFTDAHNQILTKEIYESTQSIKYNSREIIKQKFLFKENIKFINVSFYYNKKKPIIKKLNIDIKKNSCIGIIGSSGSGKSTFADLVIGLLKPSKGLIKIDNTPLVKNIDDWQNKISYVSQSPFFLNDTIEKNIAFGLSSKKIDKKLLIEVAKKVRIYEHINSLHLKFKTIVGESGINFSGGQLQRIAIARALYKKSQLLILDESTNALDNQNEENFFKFLKSLKKRVTIIIISHKSKNLLLCDKVYKINN